MLLGEGFEFLVYKNSDLKCAFVVRVHLTIRDRI